MMLKVHIMSENILLLMHTNLNACFFSYFFRTLVLKTGPQMLNAASGHMLLLMQCTSCISYGNKKHTV